MMSLVLSRCFSGFPLAPYLFSKFPHCIFIFHISPEKMLANGGREGRETRRSSDDIEVVG